MLVIKATDTFGKRAAKLLTQTEQERLVAFLAANPEAGDVIAGSGGVRKLRWGMAGQGKRGGARVLHLFLRHRGTLWLVDIYSKREKADLSAGDLRLVRLVADAIKGAPA